MFVNKNCHQIPSTPSPCEEPLVHLVNVLAVLRLEGSMGSERRARRDFRLRNAWGFGEKDEVRKKGYFPLALPEFSFQRP